MQRWKGSPTGRLPAAASGEAAAGKGSAPAAGSVNLSGGAVAGAGEVSEPLGEDKIQGGSDLIHLTTRNSNTKTRCALGSAEHSSCWLPI